MAIKLLRLLKGNDTLYGVKPSVIAHAVEAELNRLNRTGLAVISVTAVPDYHNFGSDGGVKDVFFVIDTSIKPKNLTWKVQPLIDDHATLHGKQCDAILERLEPAIADLTRSGWQIQHLLMITDHHGFATGNGIGGFDGVKNVLICTCK